MSFLSSSSSRKKANGVIYLLLFLNSNKCSSHPAVRSAELIHRSGISGKISSGEELWARSRAWFIDRGTFSSGRNPGKIRRLMREQISAARCVLEDERGDFHLLFSHFWGKSTLGYAGWVRAALNFRNETPGERDANKTPTHGRLPRKHARRGIVNIWTSKRGKRRLIGGCWPFFPAARYFPLLQFSV